MTITDSIRRITLLTIVALFFPSQQVNAAAFFALDELNNNYTIAMGGDPYFSPGRTITKWQASDATNISYAFDPVFSLPGNAGLVPIIESALSQWSATTPALGFTPSALAAAKDEYPTFPSIFAPPVFPSSTSISISHGAQIDFFGINQHLTSSPGAGGIAEINFAYDDSRILSADIYLNLNFSHSLTELVALHEIGHALGFSHTEEVAPPFPFPVPTPNNYDPFLLNASPSQFVLSPNTSDALMHYSGGGVSGLTYHEEQGAIFLYGAASSVPEPSGLALAAFVILLLTARGLFWSGQPKAHSDLSS